MKKKVLVDKAIEVLENKIEAAKDQISSLQDSMNADGKSTVGDKHETNRAMIQNEIEQLGKSLFSHEQHLKMFSAIDFTSNSKKVESGSYVITNKFHLFLGVSLGKITIKGEDVQFVSMESPIAQALLLKEKGEKVRFRDFDIELLEVY